MRSRASWPVESRFAGMGRGGIPGVCGEACGLQDSPRFINHATAAEPARILTTKMEGETPTCRSLSLVESKTRRDSGRKHRFGSSATAREYEDVSHW